MENLPEHLYEDYMPRANRASGANNPGQRSPNLLSLCRWIKDLQIPEKRASALQLIATNRGMSEDLALLLWTSFGTISTLLQEIVGVYPQLHSEALTQRTSTRVFNALLLLQCVASHQGTRKKFLRAMIPHYLYPILNTTSRGKPHEYLRLGSLGVIAAMVKADDPTIALFLLETEAFPYVLQCINIGSTPTKTVATFIVHKILSQDEGLRFCCFLPERFYAIESALRSLLDELAAAEKPSQELLQLVIGCYFRLSGKPRACDGLKCSLPAKLRDSTFIKPLREDPTAMEYRRQLLQNLASGRPF